MHAMLSIICKYIINAFIEHMFHVMNNKYNMLSIISILLYVASFMYLPAWYTLEGRETGGAGQGWGGKKYLAPKYISHVLIIAIYVRIII